MRGEAELWGLWAIASWSAPAGEGVEISSQPPDQQCKLCGGLGVKRGASTGELPHGIMHRRCPATHSVRLEQSAQGTEYSCGTGRHSLSSQPAKAHSQVREFGRPGPLSAHPRLWGSAKRRRGALSRWGLSRVSSSSSTAPRKPVLGRSQLCLFPNKFREQQV